MHFIQAPSRARRALSLLAVAGLLGLTAMLAGVRPASAGPLSVSSFGATVTSGNGVTDVRTAANAAALAPSCKATYSVVSKWNTGFVPVLTVTNTGPIQILGWTVTLTYFNPGNQVLQPPGWNGTWSQATNGTVTVTNASYNGKLDPAKSAADIGAIFSFTSTSDIGGPESLTCTPKTVTVTQPTNQTGTVGTAVTPLQIQATDSVPGQTSLTFTATGLPPTLGISPSTGLITGTPITPGTFTVTVTATDATSASGSATFTWIIS
jgi:hypothetical protein